MKNYGFQDGDKILKVNGVLKMLLIYQKYLFLRDVSSVTVEHSNGKIEKLSIPENIGHVMMESGVMDPFSPFIKPIIGQIEPNSLAEKLDFQNNDRIVSINDLDITKWQQLSEFTKDSVSKELKFELLRGDSTIEKLAFLEANKTLGVLPKRPDISITKINFELTESISEGYDKAYWILSDYIKQFEYVFTPKGITQLGGFGAIGNIFPASWDWQRFWESTALLSLILAFMNILPIPALDGGHVMFLIYEIVTGSKLK